MSYVLNYVASPVRNYVASLLVSALSKYIIGIEVNCTFMKSISIIALGILSQELNLQNVELNLSSIEEDLGIKLPFVIKSSFARSLRIVIPWTSLLSLPIGVYIENLDIELCDSVFHYSFWHCRLFLQFLQKPKLILLRISLRHILLITRADDNDTTSANRGLWGDRYLKRILSNISIRVDNVVVKYTHENLHTVLSSKVLTIFIVNNV